MIHILVLENDADLNRAVCLHLRRNRSVNLVREYRIGRIG